MATISGLFIYPIKSLGGIELDSVLVTDRGLQYDRRWMLVDANGRFLTQREHPVMALLQVGLGADHLLVFHKHHPEEAIQIPLDLTNGIELSVTIWDDTVQALLVDKNLDNWFSRQLGINCSLVYMPDSSRREVDSRYASQKEITSFSDAYPMLLIGQASLDDLNTRLASPVPMNRFRPNIVVEGWEAYEEDSIGSFQAGAIKFTAVKPCARCVLTTINQETGEKGKDPLKTLASYRTQNNKVLFGQNLVHIGSGYLEKGMNIISF
ncbi:MOSC domain-containing protein [Flavihumibacter sp. UBA7668]|uniref:MOSC domain-containing protein n=1 Tax=Flavihumibacter sp. UBA7668 TaxID=1946542 RepID=UPI0025BAA9DF|nr:MOSC N-terminal beta barrel domain-containing protein [Flavihumibacter sp. UBA7668]